MPKYTHTDSFQILASSPIIHRSARQRQCLKTNQTVVSPVPRVLHLLPISSPCVTDCFANRCPELNACISAALWCDGSRHCPSGFDEEEANCAYQFGIPLLYVTIGAGALAVLALLIAVSACVKYGRHRRNERKKKKNKSSGDGSGGGGGGGSNNANHLHANHLHNNGDSLGKRYPSSADDTFHDGKDSLC